MKKSEAIDFFFFLLLWLIACEQPKLFPSGQILSLFFCFVLNLFHLKKIEFTSEILTHARVGKC